MNGDSSTNETEAVRQRIRETLAGATSGSSNQTLIDRVVHVLTDREFSEAHVTAVLVESAGHAIDVWLDLLDHFRWRVRIGSMRVLAELGEFQAVRSLVRILQSDCADELLREAEMSLSTILEKTQSQHRLDVETMTWLFQYRSARVVDVAAAHLDSFAHADRVACLNHGLQNRNPDCVVATAVAAALLEAFDVIPVLEQLVIRGPKPRTAARDAMLSLIRSKAIEQSDNRRWFDVLLRSRDPDVAVASVERLAGFRVGDMWPWSEELGEAHRLLMEQASDADEESETEPAPREHLPNSWEQLLAAVGDCLPIAQMCVSQLVRDDLQSCDIRRLLPCLESDSDDVRDHIAETVRSILVGLRDDSGELEQAVAALNCGHLSVVAAAIDTLKHFGNESVLNDLYTFEANAPAELRSQIRDAIQTIEALSRPCREADVEGPVDTNRVARIKDVMRQQPDATPVINHR